MTAVRVRRVYVPEVHTITHHVPIPGGNSSSNVVSRAFIWWRHPEPTSRDSWLLPSRMWCYKEVESALTWPEKTFFSSCGPVLLWNCRAKIRPKTSIGTIPSSNHYAQNRAYWHLQGWGRVQFLPQYRQAFSTIRRNRTVQRLKKKKKLDKQEKKKVLSGYVSYSILKWYFNLNWILKTSSWSVNAV